MHGFSLARRKGRCREAEKKAQAPYKRLSAMGSLAYPLTASGCSGNPARMPMYRTAGVNLKCDRTAGESTPFGLQRNSWQEPLELPATIRSLLKLGAA